MAIGAVAARGARGAKGAAKGALSMMQGEPPKLLSPEGLVMLTLAAIFEVLNVFFVFLDFVFGVGFLIAPIVNGVALVIIGGWMWARTGQFPIRRIILPFLGNAVPIPLLKIVPFWAISVWMTLEK